MLRKSRVSALVEVTLAVLFTDSLLAATNRYMVRTRVPGKVALRQVVEASDSIAPERRGALVFESVPGFAAELTDEEVAQLRKSPDVLYVEEDAEIRAFANDTVVRGQETTPYGVTTVRAPEVWAVTKGRTVTDGKPVHVVVIDTGIDYESPELVHAYVDGRNLIAQPPSNDPRDDNGHGSHVAGTIAAAMNTEGVVGVAPEVEIHAIKVLNACGSGSVALLVKAVDWVLEKKAERGGLWIMSLSLGSSTSRNLEREAFQKAADAGILTVAASGNGYNDNPIEEISFPAAYPSVVAVGAIAVDEETKAKTIAGFSQRGPELKLVAPGVAVLSTVTSAGVSTNDGRTLAGALPVATNAEAEEVCLPIEPVTAKFVFCGFGGTAADFPDDVRGKIALIERGNGVLFVDKAKNALAAGAIGAVIFNNVDGAFGMSMEIESPTEIPLTLGISRADGEALRATPDAELTLSFGRRGFANFNGTSMATPHVSAVAALAWAVAPTATASQIREALIATASDLGEAGYDTTFGHGLVDALAAAKSLAPSRFGVPAQPSGPPTIRRILVRGR